MLQVNWTVVDTIHPCGDLKLSDCPEGHETKITKLGVIFFCSTERHYVETL